MNAPRTRYTGYTAEMGKTSTKYIREKLDPMTVRFPKGYRAKITEHTDLTGETIVGFFKRAVDETIARDRARMREGFKPEPVNEE